MSCDGVDELESRSRDQTDQQPRVNANIRQISGEGLPVLTIKFGPITKNYPGRYYRQRFLLPFPHQRTSYVTRRRALFTAYLLAPQLRRPCGATSLKRNEALQHQIRHITLLRKDVIKVNDSRDHTLTAIKRTLWRREYEELKLNINLF